MPTISTKDEPQKIDIDVKGIHVLVLEANPGADGSTNDHADWAEARLEVSGAMPTIVAAPKDEAIVLTPPVPET